jgi:hypothetical protein
MGKIVPLSVSCLPRTWDIFFGCTDSPFDGALVCHTKGIYILRLDQVLFRPCDFVYLLDLVFVLLLAC